ncbi:hypothetical protein NliqN6_5913 [Naganishia liquefaciens]|uniref:Retrotransposon gag domain-containing protein n=1 Tax=Naganishia liquefaciens TaxID=104408 RepID=A0A8H3TZ22_9TREE|nr:hypothetical protein NliqN6_5913 [Naganishia liquefaciens]
MPPRPSRTPAGPSNVPVNRSTSVTPTPPPPSAAPSEPPSNRSQDSLTPAPPSPLQANVVEASAAADELRLPETRLATPAEVDELNEIIAGLQRRVQELRPEPTSSRAERHPTFEQETSYRQSSFTPSIYASVPHKPKLKASDLPKFSGKDHEDVDQWIEKVTAIYEYSGVHDTDLLQQLPLVLQGNALTWFTQLGKERHSLKTWHSWQIAIRNAFYMPNHRANLRRQCLYRTLRANESFGDYFSDKKRLQSYVFPDSTPTHELIDDMIEGIPLSIQPLIKANISRYTTLEEFRRILIDLGPGLRGRKNFPPTRVTAVSNYERTDRKDGSTTISQTRDVKPAYSSSSPPSLPRANFDSPPRTNCYNCGGNHWRRDCPHQPKPREDTRSAPSTRTYTSQTVSDINRTPSNGSKWKAFSKSSNAITTRAKAKNVEPPPRTPTSTPVEVPSTLPPPPVPTYSEKDLPFSRESALTEDDVQTIDKDDDVWQDKLQPTP